MFSFVGSKPREDIVLIDKFVDLLDNYRSINRINLYACKSGLIPLMAHGEILEKRRTMVRASTAPRHRCGLLSYAEFFIIKLEEAFQKRSLPFPADLSVVACLGDVKENEDGLFSRRGRRAYGVLPSDAEDIDVVEPATAMPPPRAKQRLLVASDEKH